MVIKFPTTPIDPERMQRVRALLNAQSKATDETKLLAQTVLDLHKWAEELTSYLAALNGAGEIEVMGPTPFGT